AGDITVTSVTYTSSNQIRASIVISTAVSAGATYSINLTNPDGQTTTLSSTFTISGPTITSAYEDVYQRFLSRHAYDYVINGTNFSSWGTTPDSVTFRTSGGAITSDISVTSVTYTSATRLRASIVIANTVTGGPYTIRVTNPGGQFAEDTSTFTISTPTISGAFEDVAKHYLSSKTYDYVINGSSFAVWNDVSSSVTVVFSGGGASDVAVTSITYVSPSQIRASLILGTNVQNTTYTITATNPYSLYATDSSTFTFSSITVTGVYEDVNQHYK